MNGIEIRSNIAYALYIKQSRWRHFDIGSNFIDNDIMSGMLVMALRRNDWSFGEAIICSPPLN